MKKDAHNLPAAGALGEQLPLIDPPSFGPAWPKRNSLAAVVFQLRALGWSIDTLEIPAPSEERPGRTFALYGLPTKYAAQALATMTAAVQ